MAEKRVPMLEKKESKNNFLRQFRDKETREFKQISASQFMEVWNHYDSDGNGFIEDSELDGFLKELVTSVNTTDVGPEVISDSALKDAKKLVLNAFDENNDGRIDIAELAQILPMEQNFLLLFRRDHPLDSSVEFMKIWREYDSDHSGYIEADELKNFLHDLLKRSKKDTEVSEEQLIVYADTMLQLFDRNRDGKLQLSEMAKLLPVKENFLCRPIFKVGSTKKMDFLAGCSRLSPDDIDRVFNLYDVDRNGYIENEELHGFLKDLMELVEDDYDADDLLDCQKILLDKCDLNQDGKINKEELTMVLTSCNKANSSD
ncbi:calbindin-32-like isoform X1 [Ruditapes philippinarum]|uniref:calbindin-32-like isoform X1 n=1 Tax=Ruditapes philippinarum TaxID=129788 RepID=UPI00295A7977|nr:calbindin-32-like isoform X1 [Ruditapes philippinarum]